MQRIASTSVCEGDENSNGSSLAELTQAFSQRVAELQQLLCLRIGGAVDRVDLQRD